MERVTGTDRKYGTVFICPINFYPRFPIPVQHRRVGESISILPATGYYYTFRFHFIKKKLGG